MREETDVNQSELRFLVVDDYPDFRQLAVIALATLGYAAVDTAKDGQEALEKLRSGHYDFVLSDISMPRMSGFMLLRAIKGDLALRHLPVLIMSTYPEREYREVAILRGAVDYLEKPLSKKTLGSIIQKVLADPAYFSS